MPKKHTITSSILFHVNSAHFERSSPYTEVRNLNQIRASRQRGKRRSSVGGYRVRAFWYRRAFATGLACLIVFVLLGQSWSVPAPVRAQQGVVLNQAPVLTNSGPHPDSEGVAAAAVTGGVDVSSRAAVRSFFNNQ
jgi:hypothetical protein